MDEKKTQRCQLFVDNNAALYKKYWYKWQGISSVSSLLLANGGKRADIEEIENARRIIKDNFGIFSNIRGFLELPLASSMVLTKDPKQYLDDVNEIYKEINKGTIFHSEFQLLAAMVMEGQKDHIDVPETVAKMNEIFKAMEKKHLFLTDRSDLATATVFAMTGRDTDSLINEMEDCYKIIKKELGFLSGEESQSAAAILTLSDKPVEEKCQKFLDIIKEMKKRKMSLTFNDASPVAAELAMIDKPVKDIVDEVEETFNWLKGKPGFRFLEMGKSSRVTFAMMLTGSDEMINSAEVNTLTQSMLTSIILIELIILMMIIISASASHSSSSSSH